MSYRNLDILKYDAFIFDLDGTLVDSMGMWGDIDREYLDRFHIPVPDQFQDTIVSMTWDEMRLYFRNVIGVPRTTEEIGQDWVQMADTRYRHQIHLKGGASEIISFAKRHRKKVALTSSGQRVLVEHAMAAQGLLNEFDAIVTCDEAGAGKPDPAVYSLAARKLGVSPSRCLVFDDLLIGIYAARSAGMDVVAVDDWFSRRDIVEKRELSDDFIYDFRELM